MTKQEVTYQEVNRKGLTFSTVRSFIVDRIETKYEIVQRYNVTRGDYMENCPKRNTVVPKVGAQPLYFNGKPQNHKYSRRQQQGPVPVPFYVKCTFTLFQEYYKAEVILMIDFIIHLPVWMKEANNSN